jgi:hypothetical protein
MQGFDGSLRLKKVFRNIQYPHRDLQSHVSFSDRSLFEAFGTRSWGRARAREEITGGRLTTVWRDRRRNLDLGG